MGIGIGRYIWVLCFLIGAVVSSEEKLQIGVLKKVENCVRQAQNGDRLSMHYEGKLADGTKFDASYDRGTPLELTLGAGMVIKGWDQGILGMCEGEIRKLKIPPSLAYGAEGRPPTIPANSMLIFKVELVKIHDKDGETVSVGGEDDEGEELGEEYDYENYEEL